MPYFHGSFDPLDVGLHLSPSSDAGSTDPDLDTLFEVVRPADRIPRAEAVYLVTNPDDIDAVGGYTDHVYEVEPEGTIEKCDLAWYSQAQ
jgi:hypothetical protein